MNRRNVLAAAAASLALASWVAPAAAQTMQSVAGTYQVIKIEPYGENARGVLTLTPNGFYSITLARATLPKFASNNRLKGTPEENMAIVHGSIFHYGRYTIDDGGKAITFNVQTSTFPNWDGTTQKRALKIAGDLLTFTVTAPSGGGAPNDVVWKRMK